jgi:mannose-6-phosphate isomerase-like protein (cupin superfamily)
MNKTEIEEPFHDDIERVTNENTNYRKVLYTDKYMQLVIQCLLPEEDVGFEVHPHTTQFLRCEYGNGIVIIDNIDYEFYNNVAITIPPGSNHNIINTGKYDTLNFYTIYSTNLAKEHLPGEVQKLKYE